MVRTLYAVILSLLLILAVLPSSSGLPEAPEEIFYYSVSDDEGDAHENCERMTDLSPPTPCDILAFEVGNTDTHLMVRLTLATTEFGTLGSMGYTNYEFTMLAGPGDEESFTIVSNLTSDGTVTVSETQPPEWQSELEAPELEGENQIRYAIPLSLLGTLMDGEAEPHVSWLNLTSVKSGYVLIPNAPPGINQFQGENIDNMKEGITEDNKLYVLQAFGELSSPVVEPRVFDSASDDAELQVSEQFETGPPSMDDPCVPWNGTCFMASQPITAHYNYHWTTPYTSVEFSLQAEGESGTGELVIKGPSGAEVFRESFGSGTTELQDLLRPIEAGTVELSVQLDRYEGSFELLAKEGPAPEGGDGGTDDGSDDGGGNNNEDTNETSDPDADLDDSNGAPGPAIVVVLAILAGIVSLKRRR